MRLEDVILPQKTSHLGSVANSVPQPNGPRLRIVLFPFLDHPGASKGNRYTHQPHCISTIEIDPEQGRKHLVVEAPVGRNLSPSNQIGCRQPELTERSRKDF
jgi:hypothetical protein